MNSRLALLAFAVNPLLWASFYTVAKPSVEQINPIVFSTVELLWVVPAATFILLWRRHFIHLKDVLKAIIAAISLYLVILLSAWALVYTTATETAFYPGLNGLFASLIGYFFLRRSISVPTWFGGLFAACGVLLILPALGDHLRGNLLALAAAFAYTGYIYVAEWVTKDADSDLWVIFAFELIFMAGLSTIATMMTGRVGELLDLPMSIYIAAIYIGVMTTFVPTAISIGCQRYISPVTTAFLYAFEPLWSSLFAAFFLGEYLSGKIYLGGLLILLGTLVHSSSSITAKIKMASWEKLP